MQHHKNVLNIEDSFKLLSKPDTEDINSEFFIPPKAYHDTAAKNTEPCQEQRGYNDYKNLCHDKKQFSDLRAVN